MNLIGFWQFFRNKLALDQEIHRKNYKIPPQKTTKTRKNTQNRRTSSQINKNPFFEFDLNQSLELYESLMINVKYQNQKLKSSKFDIESQNYLKLKNRKLSDLNNFRFIKKDLIIGEGKTYITNPLIIS